MRHTKPILALSLLGAGIAALVVCIQMQRDRFAFTSQTSSSSSAPPAAKLAERPRPAPVVLTLTRVERQPEIPTMTLEALPVLPRNPPARRATPAEDSMKLENPACNPKWRSLESGPIGRIYRDICPTPGSVPRS